MLPAAYLSTQTLPPQVQNPPAIVAPSDPTCTPKGCPVPAPVPTSLDRGSGRKEGNVCVNGRTYQVSFRDCLGMEVATVFDGDHQIGRIQESSHPEQRGMWTAESSFYYGVTAHVEFDAALAVLVRQNERSLKFSAELSKAAQTRYL